MGALVKALWQSRAVREAVVFAAIQVLVAVGRVGRKKEDGE